MNTDSAVFLVCAVLFGLCAGYCGNRTQLESRRLSWTAVPARIANPRIDVSEDADGDEYYKFYASCHWSYQKQHYDRRNVFFLRSYRSYTVEAYRDTLLQSGLTLWLDPLNPRDMTVLRPSRWRLSSLTYCTGLALLAVGLCIYALIRPAVFLENDNQFSLTSGPICAWSFCASLAIICFCCGFGVYGIVEWVQKFQRLGFSIENLVMVSVCLALCIAHVPLFFVIHGTLMPDFKTSM